MPPPGDDGDDDSELSEHQPEEEEPNNNNDNDADDALKSESERPNKRTKRSKMDEEMALEEDDEDEEEDDDDDEDYKERSKPRRTDMSGGDAKDSSKEDDDDEGENKAKEEKKQKMDQYVALPGYGEHKRAVSSVKFAPGRLMKKDNPTAALCASSAADGCIKLWNVQDSAVAPANAASKDNHKEKDNNNKDKDQNKDGDTAGSMEPTLTCVGHTRGINDICWNPVSPFLASASDDKTVRLWDMVTGDALVEYKGHDSFVFCVDQYQHMIVSGSFDETVKLWDIRSGDCVSTFPAHSDPVTSVSFNRDGTVVCSASHDGLIRLWDVASGECLKTIYAAGNPPVCHAKFSPNSKYILAGSLDAKLRLWPVNRTGTNLCAKLYQSEHHVNQKYSIVADFTCDGNIVTGSETGNVILYDLQSQDVLQVMEQHEDAVLAVSAHDKLPLLASGAMMNDRRVHFWAPQSFKF